MLHDAFPLKRNADLVHVLMTVEFISLSFSECEHHFLDRPGGVAFFEATDKEQEERIRQASELPAVQAHPLIHSRSAAGFVAQLDYTSGTYFNIPLSALTERIRKAKEENRSPYQA